MISLKKYIISITVMACSTLCGTAKPLAVTSPDGSINLEFDTKKGVPYYSVTHKGHPLLNESRLGLKLKEQPDFAEGISVKSADRDSHSETWQPVWGEESLIDNNYNELRVNLQQKKIAPGRNIAIVFRVFNDGIGFRYEFPRQQSLQDFVIMDELTEFAFDECPDTWSIPAEGYRFYEALFRELPLDRMGKVSTPVTMRCADGTHLALHEANLTDYAAMNLQSTPGSTVLKAELTPWQSGEKVFVTDVRVSPWRTLIIADNAGDMALSRIMLNLNEPCAIENAEEFCVPQRYLGVWWCYHMKTATWEAGEKHGATTENVKRYMDFAARHNFGGVLVEGWNHDWVTWDFSFTRPYEDFDIAELNRYGREKGVALIGHHETGGKIANYERQMEDGMKLYADNGMHYVKTGYVGDMLDNKELHSSQFGVRHYRKVIETAARHRLAIDNHEPVMPTGLQRTYPNLMTQEGVRGQEWDAWCPEGGNPPSHTVTLPFTRGLAGPMDFTPVTFRFENPVMPQTHVNTTLAKQLALFVILYSPLQMASDEIENYESNPGPFQFVCDCPTDWDKTVFPEAEIGKYITTARKEKGGDSWFVGSATGDEARTANINLSFLDPECTYRATIYRDGENANYDTDPYPVIIEQKDVTSDMSLTIPQGRSGGCAIKLTKLAAK
ncbi:MAG: glycoside hydrolase family 97 protein [Muribaculaceae bacterium]|nr:glycoside hydrolase family 97 protein [Muribaculaceae bacterium]